MEAEGEGEGGSVPEDAGGEGEAIMHFPAQNYQLWKSGPRLESRTLKQIFEGTLL